MPQNDPKMSTKIAKKDKKKQNKKDAVNQKLKNNKDSDSDDDYEDEDWSEDEDEEVNMHEIRKQIAKILPSKHINKKIKAGERFKDTVKELVEDSKTKSKSKKGKKKIVEESEEESEKDSDDEESDDEEGEETEISGKNSRSNKFNIIFTIGQNMNYEDDDDEYEDDEEWADDDDDDSEEESEDEDEDIEVSTDEDTDDSEDDSEDDEEDPKYKTRSHTKSKKQKDTEDKDTPSTNDEETLANLRKLYETNSNPMLEKCIEDCEAEIKIKNEKTEKKNKKQKQKNSRIFKKIVRDKNSMNDFAFFNKLEKDEQVKIIKEVREINKITLVEKPYRITLLEAQIPAIFKATAMKKINSLRYMEPGSGEFYKIKTWVDTFMRIPFNNYEKLPISINDGVDACHEFMDNAHKTLNEAVYGLNDAKMQIMQMLGQLVTNPCAMGSAIAIKGPMGTGKTTLVKEGISKILKRPFAFIALGGATDSSFLEGHSYTYEGSMWGKIVQILIDSKCMNPVIYFDELDKISDTPKGEEIAGILTHLTDTSQNNQFHDKYFAEVDFDLSKCLFIFSYNDENKINPILRDRMYRIQTKGYDKKQKTTIINDYMLPKIREQVKFNDNEITIPEETMHYIIDTHCEKEDGVRNLKRCLEIIYTKLNLYRLMKPDTNIFEEDMSLKVEFPFQVNIPVVDKLIKKEEDNMSYKSMYI
jgi:ATP-dependent Lon protease